MRASRGSVIIFLLAGCQTGSPPPDPELVEPGTFAQWPSVTDAPIPVSTRAWLLCRHPTPEEAQEQEAATKAHGPHAGHTIVVRVSPEAVASFRDGKPLPTGAIVVKEKHFGTLGTGPVEEYALMIKRQPGYNPAGGDWEYAYVTHSPGRKVDRGRIETCADCHSRVKDRDYLFHTYLRAKKE